MESNKKLISLILSFVVLLTSILSVPMVASAAETNCVKLSTLTAGSTVRFGGTEWIVLDPASGYLLLKGHYKRYNNDLFTYFQFDTSGSTSYNPNSETNIAYRLNGNQDGDFYNSLLSSDAALINNRTWLLLDDSNQYLGEVTCKIGMISHTEWNTYKNLVGTSTQRWWMRTPYSQGAGKVVTISPDGASLGAIDANTQAAVVVRPTIYISPNLMVWSGNNTVLGGAYSFPSVTEISEHSGPYTGGTQVTITGTGFNGATKVYFGSTEGTNLRVTSSTAITVTSPPSSGTVDITVECPWGTSLANDNDKFTYIPASVDLTDIILNGNPSGYSFLENNYSYNGVSVASDVESITVTPTGAGTITVNGIDVASGSTSPAIDLAEGFETTITVVATEMGKISKTYTIKVMRELGYYNVTPFIDAGSSHAVALRDDGTVWTWGSNADGQLGNDSTDDSSEAVQVRGLSRIKAVSASSNHSLALCDSGTVMAWGDNSYGQLGDGSNTGSTTPVAVEDLTDVIAVSAGGSRHGAVSHSAALKKDGTVWTWGNNACGQLGDGTKNNSSAPVQVTGLPVAITAAYAGCNFTAALGSDKKVYTWGNNENGELGYGGITGFRACSLIPIQIGSLDNVEAISVGGGFHTLALKSDGTVWAWGWNYNGNIGDGTNVNSNVPVQVSGLSNIIAVSAGEFTSMALDNGGNVWVWGRGYNTTPQKIDSNSDYIAVSAGGGFYLMIKANGIVTGELNSGEYNYGQLGNGINLITNPPAITTGTITGNVMDGIMPLEGANVSLTVSGDVYSAVTAIDGSYRIADIPSGTGYTLTASKAGYIARNVTNVSVTANTTTAGVNISLNIISYNVEGSASPAVGGIVSGGGTYNESASVTVTATANSGYTFTNWTEGSVEVSTEASYTFTMSTADRTLVANFAAIPATLESIEITTPPTKQTYTVGESLNIDGMVVTGTYSDGSIKAETVTTANVTGFNSSTPEAILVLTVTVGGKPTTYIVTINSANNNSGNGGGNNNSGSGAKMTPPPTAPKTEISVTKNTATSKIVVKGTTDNSGKAKTSVTQAQVSDAINKAVEEASKQGNGTVAIVEIKVEVPTDVKMIEMSIPKKAVEQASTSNTSAFTVSMPIAEITFDDKSLDTISSETVSDVKISASKVDAETLNKEIRQVIGDRPVYNFSVSSGDKTISQFGGNVKVSIPYAPKKGEDINAIVIYYINANGKLETVSNCVYDPTTGTVRFNTNHFSKYAVGYNNVTFKDVSEDAWYSKAVGFIAARGIATGAGNGNFSPDTNLTRGQFIVMLMRAYGIALDASPKDNFVDAGDTYYTGYLATAKKLGITEGIGNNKFNPEKEITRQEMFTLLYNTLKIIGQLPQRDSGKRLSDFGDAGQIATWAEDAMTFLVKTGTTEGNAGKLTPESTTTRAEMAQVIYNLLSK